MTIDLRCGDWRDVLADVECDECAGMATTAIACESLGRRFIGAELDAETHAKAIKRIAAGVQIDMFGGAS